MISSVGIARAWRSLLVADEHDYLLQYNQEYRPRSLRSPNANSSITTEFTNKSVITGGNPLLTTNNNGTNLLFNDMLDNYRHFADG
jgi:alpha-amylase/alpha-mannosidase (GH57 family)